MAGGAVFAVLVLTSVHHLYGAWRFNTPWRAHVVHIAAWAAAASGVALAAAWRGRGATAGRVGMGLFLLVAGLISVWLGLYEGLYNHGIKNAAYWAGLPPAQFDRLFPAPTYERPSDWVFELSGILQTPLGLYAGLAAWRLSRHAQSRS